MTTYYAQGDGNASEITWHPDPAGVEGTALTWPSAGGDVLDSNTHSITLDANPGPVDLAGGGWTISGTVSTSSGFGTMAGCELAISGTLSNSGGTSLSFRGGNIAVSGTLSSPSTELGNSAILSSESGGNIAISLLTIRPGGLLVGNGGVLSCTFGASGVFPAYGDVILGTPNFGAEGELTPAYKPVDEGNVASGFTYGNGASQTGNMAGGGLTAQEHAWLSDAANGLGNVTVGGNAVRATLNDAQATLLGNAARDAAAGNATLSNAATLVEIGAQVDGNITASHGNGSYAGLTAGQSAELTAAANHAGNAARDAAAAASGLGNITLNGNTVLATLGAETVTLTAVQAAELAGTNGNVTTLLQRIPGNLTLSGGLLLVNVGQWGNAALPTSFIASNMITAGNITDAMVVAFGNGPYTTANTSLLAQQSTLVNVGNAVNAVGQITLAIQVAQGNQALESSVQSLLSLTGNLTTSLLATEVDGVTIEKILQLGLASSINVTSVNEATHTVQFKARDGNTTLATVTYDPEVPGSITSSVIA